jgi:hypothetical protein
LIPPTAALPHASGSIGALKKQCEHIADGLEPSYEGQGEGLDKAPPVRSLGGELNRSTCASGEPLEQVSKVVPEDTDLAEEASEARLEKKSVTRFSPILQQGINELCVALTAYQPTMILALGTAPLKLLKPDAGSVVDWRGSPFESNWDELECPCNGDNACKTCEGTGWKSFKCIATYHPTWINRDGSLTAYFKADLFKCAQELKAGPDLVLPVRKVHVAATALEAQQWIVSYHLMGVAGGKLIANDTEGTSQVSMFGFAVWPDEAHVIPFINKDGQSIWTEEEEFEIWVVLKAYLTDPKVRKVWQNWQSDAFLLAWSYGVVTEGLQHDVMLMAWEAQPELEKGLASVASIYVPGYTFWKERRDGQYVNPLDWVCGMDAMLTLQCCEILTRRLYEHAKTSQDRKQTEVPEQRSGRPDGGIKGVGGDGICQGEGISRMDEAQGIRREGTDVNEVGQWDHYRFNMENLPHTLYQMLEGLPFDKEQARKDLKVLEQAIYETQHEIDRAAWEATHNDSKVAATTMSHPSPRTARLAEWFGVVAGEGTLPMSGSQPGTDLKKDVGDKTILALATAAFATARHSEKVEVIEERWQPMRWVVCKKDGTQKGDGQWKKDGKLNYGPLTCSDAEPETKDDLSVWWKPSPRTVEISRPVPIDSWETLERFCKESCEGELRRVRRLVKELEKIYDSIATRECQSGNSDGSGQAGYVGLSHQERGATDVSASGPDLQAAIFGELSILLKVAVNSNSTNQGGDCQWLLHEAWGLPKKLKKTVKGDEGEEDDPRLTTDNAMLLTLYARCQQPQWSEWRRHSKLRGEELKAWLEVSSRRLLLVLKMRKLVKERCYLDVATDGDGRVRYGLNLVQTATGRFAAYGSPTGRSKLNPQTVGKKHRHLYTYTNPA